MNEVEEFVKKHQLIVEGDHVAVGVSGGADSLCLLYELVELRKKISFALTIIHVNHHLRGDEADKDEAFVQQTAAKLGVPCFVYAADVKRVAESEGIGWEEAGRKERYRIFEEFMSTNGANKIAVAHHKNDLAETILFRMARGTGPDGLEGIAPQRGNIIRPLLCLTREDIEHYMVDNGYEYREDLSNADVNYARNRIRIQVVPQLVKVNERAVDHIAALAFRMKEQNDYIEQQARLIYPEVIHRNVDKIALFVDKLAHCEKVIQKSLIRIVIGELVSTKKDIHEVHIQQILSLCELDTGKEIHLPYHLIAIRSYDEIVIWQQNELEKQEPMVYQVDLDKRESQLCLMESENAVRLTFSRENQEKDYTFKFDCDKIGNTVFIRKWREADEIVIDQQGHHKLVSRYFIDKKIPRHLRKDKWVLTNGKDVIWIIGERKSEQFNITDKTKNVLYIGYERED